MYPLAHIGFSLGIIKLLRNYRIIHILDLRFVIIGSLLPDLIDKPIGLVLNISGRGVFHSLIFILFLYSLLRFRFSEKKLVLNSLLYGSIAHIFLDRVFLDLKIFLWPLLGFKISYSVVDVNYYFLAVFNSLYVQITEFMGLMILVSFILVYGLYRKDNIITFILEGSL